MAPDGVQARHNLDYGFALVAEGQATFKRADAVCRRGGACRTAKSAARRRNDASSISPQRHSKPRLGKGGGSTHPFSAEARFEFAGPSAAAGRGSGNWVANTEPSARKTPGAKPQEAGEAQKPGSRLRNRRHPKRYAPR
jgi:hypothetical protein